MIRFSLLFFILSTTFAWSSPQLIIKNNKQYPFNQAKLEDQFKTAYSEFEKEISPLVGTITLTISPDSCLRTAFNRESKEVEFCPGKNVFNAGLDSVDIINHELFHAFICSYDDTLCDMKEKDYLHEALADTFAYNLNPDDVFGENFYKNQVFLRRYMTTHRVGLVQGEHEKGNALSAQFIREKTPLIKLLPLFHEADIPEEVEDIISGAPKSRLNRYRLALNQVMQIEFQFAETAGVHSVEWSLPEGVEVKATSLTSFEIKITSEPESSKGFSVFLAEDGTELGRRAYYFGIKKN